MDLAQKFNELKNSDIFENLDFMKSGYVYNEKQNIQISTQYNDVSIPGVNTEEIMIKQVKSEINRSIYNKIVRDLFETDLYSVIDFRNSDFERRFLDEIRNTLGELSGYKNIILSSYLGSLIGELNSYSSTPTYSVNNSSHIYKIGKLFGIFDIWVDPYMKYNDTRIVGFNDVYIDFDNVRHKEDTNNYTFSSRLLTSFEWTYNKGASKVLYLLTDGSDPIVFSEYKKLERDLKLKKILE
jgi:hypothetical protein